MPDYIIGGVEFRRFGTQSDPPNQAQYNILRQSVQMIPIEHLPGLRRVEARRPGQVPTSGGGHNPHDKVVRLSAASFSQSYNSVVNQTFLHEMGHIVDFNFGCLGQIRQFSRQPHHPLREDANALLSTPINTALRRTHGPGEIIADCYQVMFRYLRVQTPYRNSVITNEYTGTEAQRRFRVLLATTAFSGMTIDQLAAANDEAAFDRLLTRLMN